MPCATLPIRLTPDDTMMQTSEKPKILLADDADVGRSILRALLRKDFDVVEARNGLEAIRALETSGGRFAAVILDVKTAEEPTLDALLDSVVDRLAVHNSANASAGYMI